MLGRARGVAVSNSSVELCSRSLTREKITFTVGNTANSSSVILHDQDGDATTSNGLPLSWANGPLVIEGESARHRWSAIRLAAVDCVVGVLEQFPEDDFAVSGGPEPVEVESNANEDE